MIDVVAGYARGYNAEQIRPFLKSLRGTGYQGKILLFANGEAEEEAKKWEVDLHPCPKPGMKVHSARFLCLEEALKSIPFKGAFLSDTRDVIFQKNPAEFLPSKGLNVYEEDQCMSLGTCPYNSLWIKLGYGETTLDMLKDNFISCVGTFCGDRESILNYLDKLVTEIKKIQPRTNEPQDQGAHNYLIRGQVKSHVWNNEEGEVYTVGYIKPFGVVKVEDGKVINLSKDVPAVIHQWDRHPNLVSLVEERYM